MGDSGWGESGTTILWLSLGSSWSCLNELEHVFTSTVVIALHKGCISHTFRVSAHPTAETHSPDVLSSIRSQGPGLEHGWLALRSLRLPKEMSCVLQPLSTLLLFPALALQSSWHDVTLQQLLDHTKTSRTHSLHPAREPTLQSPSPPPRSQSLRHGTSHRRRSCLKNSLFRPVASIISPYDLRKGIDR